MLWHTLLVFTRNFHLNKYSYHSILVFAQILQDTQNHLSFVFGTWKKAPRQQFQTRDEIQKDRKIEINYQGFLDTVNIFLFCACVN